jgi:hypothetical protein
MTQTIDATLDSLLAPVARNLTPELARELVSLRADDKLQARLDELAELNSAGKLSPDEGQEYDRLLGALAVISILQSQSRALLKGRNN